MKRFLFFSGAWLLSFFLCSAQMQAASVTDSVTVSTEDLADRIIAEAMKYKGTPYSYGARGPKYFDCSGFTSFIYRKFGYELSRSSGGQAGDGRGVEGSLSNLQKGDIVVFGARRSSGRVGHVGIFIEMDPSGHDFTFIHAATKGGVIVSHLKEPYYTARFMGARRIIPDFIAKSREDGDGGYGFDVENSALNGKDALVLTEGDSRIVLLGDGQWVYVNADGTLTAPSDSVKIILEPSGKWQTIRMSTHTIPSLAGAPGTASAKSSAPQAGRPHAAQDASKREGSSDGNADKDNDAPEYHVIKSGDTLYALARRYGTTVSALCSLNGITTRTTLKIGRKIRVR